MLSSRFSFPLSFRKSFSVSFTNKYQSVVLTPEESNEFIRSIIDIVTPHEGAHSRIPVAQMFQGTFDLKNLNKLERYRGKEEIKGLITEDKEVNKYVFPVYDPYPMRRYLKVFEGRKSNFSWSNELLDKSLWNWESVSAMIRKTENLSYSVMMRTYTDALKDMYRIDAPIKLMAFLFSHILEVYKPKLGGITVNEFTIMIKRYAQAKNATLAKEVFDIMRNKYNIKSDALVGRALVQAYCLAGDFESMEKISQMGYFSEMTKQTCSTLQVDAAVSIGDLKTALMFLSDILIDFPTDLSSEHLCSVMLPYCLIGDLPTVVKILNLMIENKIILSRKILLNLFRVIVRTYQPDAVLIKLLNLASSIRLVDEKLLTECMRFECVNVLRHICQKYDNLNPGVVFFQPDIWYAVQKKFNSLAMHEEVALVNSILGKMNLPTSNISDIDALLNDDSFDNFQNQIVLLRHQNKLTPKMIANISLTLIKKLETTSCLRNILFQMTINDLKLVKISSKLLISVNSVVSVLWNQAISMNHKPVLSDVKLVLFLSLLSLFQNKSSWNLQSVLLMEKYILENKLESVQILRELAFFYFLIGDLSSSNRLILRMRKIAPLSMDTVLQFLELLVVNCYHTAALQLLEGVLRTNKFYIYDVVCARLLISCHKINLKEVIKFIYESVVLTNKMRFLHYIASSDGKSVWRMIPFIQRVRLIFILISCDMISVAEFEFRDLFSRFFVDSTDAASFANNEFNFSLSLLRPSFSATLLELKLVLYISSSYLRRENWDACMFYYEIFNRCTTDCCLEDFHFEFLILSLKYSLMNPSMNSKFDYWLKLLKQYHLDDSYMSKLQSSKPSEIKLQINFYFSEIMRDIAKLLSQRALVSTYMDFLGFIYDNCSVLLNYLSSNEADVLVYSESKTRFHKNIERLVDVSVDELIKTKHFTLARNVLNLTISKGYVPKDSKVAKRVADVVPFFNFLTSLSHIFNKGSGNDEKNNVETKNNVSPDSRIVPIPRYQLKNKIRSLLSTKK